VERYLKDSALLDSGVMGQRDSSTRSEDEFPGFTDVQLIGSGGFSSVFRARETSTNRLVALKKLTQNVASDALGRTVRRELDALAILGTHPNIVTLYRLIDLEGAHPILVLELCEQSYDDLLKSGPLSPQNAISTSIKIAGALQTAHEAGILHRDVKPQNILKTQYGQPALADFGISRLQGTETETQSHALAFSVNYAAPELLEGAELSPATDVYGLAATLYTLINGSPPFSINSVESPVARILRIMRDPLPVIENTSLPLGIWELLTASLAKSPVDRPGSAAELAAALQEIEWHVGWPRTQFAVLGAESQIETRSTGEEAAAGVHTVTAERGLTVEDQAPDALHATPLNPVDADATLIRQQGAVQLDSAYQLPSEEVETTSHRRRGVKLGAVAAVVALIAGGTFAILNSSTAAWSLVPTPTKGTLAALNSVSCTSTTACMAVGFGGNGNSTLAEQWNGSAWTYVSTPTKDAQSGLNSVSCTSTTACMAVGYSGNSSGTSTSTLAEQWNGSAWTLVPTPTKGAHSLLGRVSCPSTTACMAVGESGNSSGTSTSTLAEQWKSAS